MSRPRPVFPGVFCFETRRCTQRQFLLRPDEETNNAFVYCLAEAAQRSGIDVVLSQMMSNHEHTAYYDRHGNDVEFRQRFHLFVSKCQNALRGRWENMWSSEEPCVVEIISANDLLDKLVYIATNPVKDGLVEQVKHWPGPKFVQALLKGKKLKAHRPKHFFRDDGPMPEEVELTLGLPEHFEGREAFLAELERRIAEVEKEQAEARRKSGRWVLGRGRVRRQSWRESPTSREPRRGLRPRVAARSTWARIAALQRNKEFERAYREARAKWLAGQEAVFPYGTYWLRKFAGVTASPPPSTAPLPFAFC